MNYSKNPNAALATATKHGRTKVTPENGVVLYLEIKRL